MLFDSVAFKNVIANGLVLDKMGKQNVPSGWAMQWIPSRQLRNMARRGSW